MRHDLHNNITFLSVIDPVNLGSGDTAKAGEIIDTQNCRATEYFILTGSLSDSDATFTVLLQESDLSNMGSASDIADENLLGTESGASFTFAADNKAIKIGTIPTKRYQRLTITPANNTGDVYIAAGVALVTLRGAPDTGQSN